jgi:hypothetical protein
VDCTLSKETVRTDVVPMVMSVEDCARQRGDLRISARASPIPMPLSIITPENWTTC